MQLGRLPVVGLGLLDAQVRVAAVGRSSATWLSNVGSAAKVQLIGVGSTPAARASRRVTEAIGRPNAVRSARRSCASSGLRTGEQVAWRTRLSTGPESKRASAT